MTDTQDISKMEEAAKKQAEEVAIMKEKRLEEIERQEDELRSEKEEAEARREQEKEAPFISLFLSLLRRSII